MRILWVLQIQIEIICQTEVPALGRSKDHGEVGVEEEVGEVLGAEERGEDRHEEHDDWQDAAADTFQLGF